MGHVPWALYFSFWTCGSLVSTDCLWQAKIFWSGFFLCFMTAANRQIKKAGLEANQTLFRGKDSHLINFILWSKEMREKFCQLYYAWQTKEILVLAAVPILCIYFCRKERSVHVLYQLWDEQPLYSWRFGLGFSLQYLKEMSRTIWGIIDFGASCMTATPACVSATTWIQSTKLQSCPHLSRKQAAASGPASTKMRSKFHQLDERKGDRIIADPLHS